MADPAAPSLEERAGDESWDTNARLSFARSAVRALVELHEAGTDGEPMIHRNLTPDTILVKHDNSPILTGFEHTRIPAEVSVASAAPEQNGDAAAAPEVRAQGRGAADHRSDIYSLSASLAVLFKERQDEDSAKILGALARGMADDPGARSSLADLESSLSKQLGEPIAEPPSPPARFWTEDQVVPLPRPEVPSGLPLDAADLRVLDPRSVRPQSPLVLRRVLVPSGQIWIPMLPVQLQ